MLPGFLEDPLGVRGLLPSNWENLDPTTLRTLLLAGPIGKSDNPYCRQEAEFFLQLIMHLRNGDSGAVQLIVWSRCVQLVLRCKYAFAGGEVNPIWNGLFVKLKDLTDLSLTAHVAKVTTQLENHMEKTTKRAKPSVPYASQRYIPPRFRGLASKPKPTQPTQAAKQV